MNTQQSRRAGEQGNVLFLILIAVALFAALSYVVTQSTRSGGGSTEREKNILSSAQMTQYPTALRTSIIRMVLGGVALENIKFDDPSTSPAVSSTLLVFHPQGGAANYQDAPADLSVEGAGTLRWTFNGEVEVPGIGIDDAGGNDLIAFLPGVSNGVCRQVNEELGIVIDDITPACTLAADTVAPNVAGAEAEVDARMTEADSYTFPGTAALTLEAAGCTDIFNRKASGCFYDVEGARNVFYSVLLER